MRMSCLTWAHFDMSHDYGGLKFHNIIKHVLELDSCQQSPLQFGIWKTTIRTHKGYIRHESTVPGLSCCQIKHRCHGNTLDDLSAINVTNANVAHACK